MFDFSPFNKFEKKLTEEVEVLKKVFSKSFGDAFSELSNEAKANFHPHIGRRFNNVVRDLETEITPKNAKFMANKLRADASYVKDQEKHIQQQVEDAFDLWKAEESVLNNRMRQAKTIEEMLEIDDQRYEVNRKYARDIVNLNTMLAANKRLMDGIANKQSQVNKSMAQTGRAAAVLAYIMKDISEVYLTLRKQGDAMQVYPQIWSTYMTMFRSFLKDGVMVSAVEVARATAGIQASLGTLKVPEEAIRSSADLVRYYGLSVDQATNLTGNMTRFAGWSKTAARENVQISKGLARINGVGTSQVMQDLAKNAELMANYIGRGYQTFAKSVIAARQYGVEMRRISSFADGLVNDFEATITMQAKLQTVMPGFDMSEIIYASQFGSDEQVMNALNTQLAKTGMELGTMPRSIRNMISSTLGLTVEELEKLRAGKEKSGSVKSATDADVPTKNQEFLQSFSDFLASNKALIAGIAGATIAIGWNIKALIANTAALLKSGVGGGVGKIGRLGRLGGVAKTAARRLGMVGGIAALGTAAWQMGKGVINKDGQQTWDGFEKNKGAITGAAIGSVIPGVGTLAGAGVGALGDMIMNKMGWNVAYKKAEPKPGPMREFEPMLAGTAMKLPETVTLTPSSGPLAVSDNIKVTPRPYTPPTPVEPPKPSWVDAENARLTKEDYDNSKIAKDRKAPDSATLKRTEDLLSDILSAIKSGQVINMDGKKVGQTIVAANRYGG